MPKKLPLSPLCIATALTDLASDIYRRYQTNLAIAARVNWEFRCTWACYILQFGSVWGLGGYTLV
jgi:hypothetical protein